MTESEDLLLPIMRNCYSLAKISPDPSTQNCAWIWAANNRYVRDINRPVMPGVDDSLLSDREYKLGVISHAEELAICTSAYIGVQTKGATMVCPFASCEVCARMIVAAGISRLVVHRDLMLHVPERWNTSVLKGLARMRASGVEILYIEGPVDAGSIRFDGKTWNPKELTLK